MLRGVSCCIRSEVPIGGAWGGMENCGNRVSAYMEIDVGLIFLYQLAAILGGTDDLESNVRSLWQCGLVMEATGGLLSRLTAVVVASLGPRPATVPRAVDTMSVAPTRRLLRKTGTATEGSPQVFLAGPAILTTRTMATEVEPL